MMPRMIDLIRASAVPAPLVQSAAKGALSLPADEMIEILVHLALHNRVHGEQARLTLAGWEEKSALAVAFNPNTSVEVLEYLVARENLRPKLLPTLLENPSVPDAALVRLATEASAEVVDVMAASVRVRRSPAVLQALKLNVHASGIEDLAADAHAQPAPQPDASVQTDEEVLDTSSQPEPAEEPDEVLDEEIATFMKEHAAEIAAEEGKPFQAIGGIFDGFESSEISAPHEKPDAASPRPAAETAPSAIATQRVPRLIQEERRGGALQKINKLDIKGRIQLAMKGNKEERSILIRDGTKIVALAVLDSPKISDSEVEGYASQKNVLEAVLRAIPLKRRFAKHYPVVRNLVFNPRTPLDLSLGLMKNLLVNDLRNLSSNKEVSETIRKLALKMFKQKMDPSKKS